MRLPCVLACFFLLASGCPTSGAEDGGPTDVGPAPACDGDVVCPMDRPFPNTSCLTGLSCPYAVIECTSPETADCVDGRWVFTPPDGSGCSIGGFTPPAAERCRTPFMGTRAGTVSVTIPEGGFTWGGQGGAMVGVDLLVEGEAADLTCVQAEVAVTIDGAAEPIARYAVRLRCGASNGFFVILGENPCEMREYAVEVTATVDGVGSGTTAAMLMGGQPMGGRPVCPVP